jgi:hypothetical protein
MWLAAVCTDVLIPMPPNQNTVIKGFTIIIIIVQSTWHEAAALYERSVVQICVTYYVRLTGCQVEGGVQG